jgi:hypothetical protein
MNAEIMKKGGASTKPRSGPKGGLQAASRGTGGSPLLGERRKGREGIARQRLAACMEWQESLDAILFSTYP